LSGDRLGNPQHHPAIEHDSKGPQDAGDDLPLDLAEGNEIETGGELVAREELHELAAFFLGGFVEVGRAVKMDEDEPAAALQHPVGRNRGIEAAGDERDDSSARADRKSAGAGDLIEAEEGRARQDLDRHRQLGVFQVHAGAALRLDRRAEPAIDLRRREREILIRSARVDAERGELPAVQSVENATFQLADLRRHPLDEGKVGDAEDALDAPDDLLPRRFRAEGKENPPLQRLRLGERKAADRRDQVSLQQVDEVSAVAFLQSDFVIANQDGGHAVKITQALEKTHRLSSTAGWVYLSGPMLSSLCPESQIADFRSQICDLRFAI